MNDDITTPDYSIMHERYAEDGESMMWIVWPVRVNERVQSDITDRYNEDLKKYSDTFVDLRYEAERVEGQRLGNNMINLDGYLGADPNCVVDTPDEWGIDGSALESWYDRPDGHRYAERAGWPQIKFELYERELIEAAKQRALEDASHHIRVLASWVWLAFPGGDADRYNRRGLAPLRHALGQEAATYPNVSWALCYGGDPSNWRHDHDPVGYDPDEDSTGWEQELRAYEAGGYDAVLEQRGDDDD
jgi:hypothetical protein